MKWSGNAGLFELALASRTVVQGLVTVEVTIDTEKMATLGTGVRLHNGTHTYQRRRESKQKGSKCERIDM